MSKLEFLPQQEVEKIGTARQQLDEAARRFEKIRDEIRILELEFRVLVQGVYLNYGLNPHCQVDKSGKITWPEEQSHVTDIKVEDVAAECEELSSP